MTAPQPTGDPSENGAALSPSGQQPIEVRVKFPPFDVIALRRHGPQIRPAGDPSLDYAQVRDVIHVAEYAKQVAAVAAIEIANAQAPALEQAFQAALDARLAMLMPAFDRGVSDAISAYDIWRKERRLHRRFWRWVKSQPSRGRDSVNIKAHE
jgi:hypothetical protein